MSAFEHAPHYDLKWLKNKMEMNDLKPEFVFFYSFYGDHSCFSQMKVSRRIKFEKEGVTYTSAEQYMMAMKAILFNDQRSYQEIMNARKPSEMKKVGRRVKGFNQMVWDDHKARIIFEGNLLKFSQNEEFKEHLLSTGDKILVEASPYDGVYGIKMSIDDKNKEDPYKWKGENLLGFTLMSVRDYLRSQNKGEEPKE